VENRYRQQHIGGSKPGIIGHRIGLKANSKIFQKNFKKSKKDLDAK
jgi:hypothetical protein